MLYLLRLTLYELCFPAHKEIACKDLTILRTVQKMLLSNELGTAQTSSEALTKASHSLYLTEPNSRLPLGATVLILPAKSRRKQHYELARQQDTLIRVSQSQDWHLPSFYSAQERDGVVTGEESMLAGWKSLYRLQELIKLPLEQRGTNGECFCTLCLKLTGEQSARAQVPAPQAAGWFIQ